MIDLETFNADIKENYINKLGNGIIELLLTDQTLTKNIIWATDNYKELGNGYQYNDEIYPLSIIGDKGNIIKPRAIKSKEEQADRARKKAEVFTPSWICNAQNNLVDNAWFESENIFNTENSDKTWTTNTEKIPFPTSSGKTWQDYVNDRRLEITCGEAPYLVSRYDTATGEIIPIEKRIGLLDRKLRVVSENISETDMQTWFEWVKIAYQNIYGFDWQGDNVLLARENLLATFIEYFNAKFNDSFSNKDEEHKNMLKEIATIVSWNIWQMDGLKFVIPDSCKNDKINPDNFQNADNSPCACPGCAKNDPFAHTGKYCYIMDWKKKQKTKFVKILKKQKAKKG